jgi:two-component system chemotaxis response regulator CheY
MRMERRYQVLAVDDSAFTLTILSAYLEGSEFEIVETARNGQEALERFRATHPDLVLMDLVMPGWSGEETLQRLLEVEPGADIIMVSSLGTEEAVSRCLDIGARDFLKKPFKKDELLEFLRNHVSAEGKVS